MASSNAANAFGGSQQHAIFLHGPDKIVAASRLKTALSPDQRAKRPLIYTDQQNHRPSGQIHQALPQKIHDRRAEVGHGCWDFTGPNFRLIPSG
jgi:hypothetical protein